SRRSSANQLTRTNEQFATARRYGFEADMKRHNAISEIVSRHAPNWRENSESWSKSAVLIPICADLDTGMLSNDEKAGLYEIPDRWRNGKTEALKGTKARGWSDTLKLAGRKLVTGQIANSLKMVLKSEANRPRQT